MCAAAPCTCALLGCWNLGMPSLHFCSQHGRGHCIRPTLYLMSCNPCEQGQGACNPFEFTLCWNADSGSSSYDAAAPSSVVSAGPTISQAAMPASKAYSQLSPGVLQLPTYKQGDTATPAAAATKTDSYGSATAAKDLLSTMTGELADSPGVSPAPAGVACPPPQKPKAIQMPYLCSLQSSCLVAKF
jgi:hypothetical protein